ncbi:hypothetical protein GCM10010156_74510 [Planobispora rosea]|uniref:Uncharacterized protein n=1 Tax=Planobispora rosea TaxID=35762 RepID=A0A8J3WGY0_PLARO|nr:hypothetical protein GCM10010156_74510 [Planobispora rosea]GIH89000.1 hypothetical protein Pro02_74080 [Planobispora rosea]
MVFTTCTSWAVCVGLGAEVVWAALGTAVVCMGLGAVVLCMGRGAEVVWTGLGIEAVCLGRGAEVVRCVGSAEATGWVEGGESAGPRDGAGSPVPGSCPVAAGPGEAVPVTLGEGVGAPTGSAGPDDGQEGGGAAPFLSSAVPRGPILASAKTPLCSTSRTPNQAIEIAMTVAPNHTAIKPSVCRMR